MVEMDEEDSEFSEGLDRDRYQGRDERFEGRSFNGPGVRTHIHIRRHDPSPTYSAFISELVVIDLRIPDAHFIQPFLPVDIPFEWNVKEPEPLEP